MAAGRQAAERRRENGRVLNPADLAPDTPLLVACAAVEQKESRCLR